MSTTQSKYGRGFDEEFKREVATLASRPGAKQEQLARDLGVSPYSVSRWKKRYGSGPALASSADVNVAELERRIKTLERENADLREQRGNPKKSGRHCLGTPARRHGVIKSLAGEFPVKALRRVLGVSRSGYYGAQKKAQRPRAKENVRLGVRIKEAFEASRRTYGSPRMTMVLRRAGERWGRHRVARLHARPSPARHAEAPFSAPPHRQRASSAPSRPTTWPNERRRPPAPAKCGRPTSPASPQRRVGFTSPACLTPARAGSWVGRRTQPCPPPWWPAPSSVPCSGAGPPEGCSTPPTAAASTPARRTASYWRHHGVVPSMSRPGNCYDNARMESFWATLKGELMGDHLFATRAEAKTALFDYSEVFYNRRRLHSALGFQSPVDYENNLS